MLPDDSPYPARWVGTGLAKAGLAKHRPDGGTYGQFLLEDLPPLPFAFHGHFGWLSDRRSHSSHIGVERGAENAAALSDLLDAARRARVKLPRSALSFLGDPALQAKVRSNTDCHLHVADSLVRPGIGSGHLVRFLADSQSLFFWYLHLSEDGSDHSVVATPHYYGEEGYDDERDGSEIVFCAESFEAFLARFWLENEIWYAAYHAEPMPQEGAAYVEAYQRGRG